MTKSKPVPSPAAQKFFAKADEYDKKSSVPEAIKETIKEISEPHTQLEFSSMPTEMARCRIFYPISRKNLTRIQSQLQEIRFTTSHANIVFTGYPLSIADEDILRVCLALMRKQRSNHIKTTFKEIQKLLGIEKPHEKYNKKILDSLDRLSRASVGVSVKDEKRGFVTHILGHSWDSKRYKRGNKLEIKLDEWFFDKHLLNYVSLELIQFRMKLKGDVTKALFSFLQTHDPKIKTFHVNTLVIALNLDRGQEPKQHRRLLKTAFTRLQNVGFLKYKFDRKTDSFCDIRIVSKKDQKRLLGE